MYSKITSQTWLLNTAQKFETIPIDIRAPKPGSLSQLRQWGILYNEVYAEETGELVAALVPKGNNLEQLWQQLVLSFPQHGLWPVATNGLNGDIKRPWQSGELDGKQQARSGPLRFFQRENSKFAALATGTSNGNVHMLNPLELGQTFAALVIVPVTRPADAPAAVGWTGAINYDYSGADISTVLRSWEDRYGAVLMSLDFDFLTLQVAKPPTPNSDVDLLAQEHELFCPDNIHQGILDIEEYKQTLYESLWGFWWD
ncbi:DUF4253 domain-containing protein [Corynebacterium freiburgense]|uniref:DUF4253 domain-containing protein n=1 Tax=Corynebacterium freiburgense TaxID=556548 RepID=UPI00041219E3|nr:DUF4253 domain-containing protein [Corynebacterium freiburgense]WJZ02501.1 hypothetical protein CFREI_06055 [Corynebacterium freiburgense]